MSVADFFNQSWVEFLLSVLTGSLCVGIGTLSHHIGTRISNPKPPEPKPQRRFISFNEADAQDPFLKNMESKGYELRVSASTPPRRAMIISDSSSVIIADLDIQP